MNADIRMLYEYYFKDEILEIEATSYSSGTVIKYEYESMYLYDWYNDFTADGKIETGYVIYTNVLQLRPVKDIVDAIMEECYE